MNSLWALDLDLAIRRLAFSVVAFAARSAKGGVPRRGRAAPTLSESDLASAVDGFDAHLAAAMADFEEENHSSSEEDLENEPVPQRSRAY